MRVRTAALVALLASATACGADDDSSSPFGGAPKVTRFASQPMVVDVSVRLGRPGTVSVEILGDPGVAAAAPAQPARDVTVRLRGLLPGTAMTARIRIESGDDAGEELSFDLETLPALPGFQAAFETTGVGSARALLFDQSVAPSIEAGAIYAVDGVGRTRFYLPTPSDYQGLDFVVRVPAGIKLLADGRLLYVQDHRLRVVDELGTVQTEIRALDVDVAGFHHDVTVLPSGNFLVMGHEFADVKYPEATRYVAGDVVAELTPEGSKVWQWSSFAHLDVQRVLPDFFTPFQIENPQNGQLAYDWSHGNGVVYSEADDSLLVSMRHQDWVLKIDHQTSEVLWRLGEGGDFALQEGSWFYHQHSPEWQKDGSLLLYDNGIGNPTLDAPLERSRAVRFALDAAAKTATEVWQDGAESYLSPVAGDADGLDNGHVLVLDSSMPLPAGGFNVWARVREVDPSSGEQTFALRTEDERFVYRAVPCSRLPGEARP